MDERSSARLLAALMLGFLLLGLNFNLATPLFENPDESSHLMVMRYVALEAPIQPLTEQVRLDNGPAIEAYLSYHHPPKYYAPPLYYSLGALITRWTDWADLPEMLAPTPRWALGWALHNDASLVDKNFFTHHPALESWSSNSTARAIYVLRGLSMIFGALSIGGVWLAARSALPRRPGLWIGAAALIAFNPQFIANSAAVSNDTLATLFFSLYYWRAFEVIRAPAERITREALLLGLVAGLALITKQSALLMLPLGALTISLACWPQPADSRPNWPQRLWQIVRLGAIFGGLVFAIAGWWYVRNFLLYGDIAGLSSHYDVQTPLPGGLGTAELASILRSYWATFGWTVILVEEPIYYLLALLMLASLGGWFWSLRRDGLMWSVDAGARKALIVALAGALMTLAALLKWAYDTGAPYGRLLYPAAAAAGLMLAWGLCSWAESLRPLRHFYAALAMAGALFAAIVPSRYLRPAFESPLIEALPAGATRLDVAFEGGVTLAGYQFKPGDWSPGQSHSITLYWRADQGELPRLHTFVQPGPWNAYPPLAEIEWFAGGAMLPSDRWLPGDLIEQQLEFSIPEWAAAPRLSWIRVGLLGADGERWRLAEPDQQPHLGPWDPTTGQVAVIGPFRLNATVEPAARCPLDQALTGSVQMRGADIATQMDAEGLRVFATLYYSANADLPEAITLGARLLNEAGQPTGEESSAPQAGEYPTGWWLPGQIVWLRYDFLLPAGSSDLITLQAGADNQWLELGSFDPSAPESCP